MVNACENLYSYYAVILNYGWMESAHWHLPLALQTPYPLALAARSSQNLQPSLCSLSLFSCEVLTVHTEVLTDTYFPGIIFHNQSAFVEFQFTGGLTVGQC